MKLVDKQQEHYPLQVAFLIDIYQINDGYTLGLLVFFLDARSLMIPEDMLYKYSGSR
jgi:hypothetical protein